MKEYNHDCQLFMRYLLNGFMRLIALLSIILSQIFWFEGLENLKYVLVFFTFSVILLCLIVALIQVSIIIYIYICYS